jgi:hypothetical protein
MVVLLAAIGLAAEVYAQYPTLTPNQRAIADRRLSLVVTLLATGVTPAGIMNSGSRGARRPPPQDVFHFARESA